MKEKPKIDGTVIFPILKKSANNKKKLYVSKYRHEQINVKRMISGKTKKKKAF